MLIKKTFFSITKDTMKFYKLFPITLSTEYSILRQIVYSKHRERRDKYLFYLGIVDFTSTCVISSMIRRDLALNNFIVI